MTTAVGEPKTPDQIVHYSPKAKKPNPHLLGYEANLEALNKFISEKKERLITKK
jgi:hypothetical protein